MPRKPLPANLDPDLIVDLENGWKLNPYTDFLYKPATYEGLTIFIGGTPEVPEEGRRARQRYLDNRHRSIAMEGMG